MDRKMAKKKKKDPVADTEQYIAFLEKRVASKNYKNNVSKEEFQKTQEKLKKAKLRLRILRGPGQQT